MFIHEFCTNALMLQPVNLKVPSIQFGFFFLKTEVQCKILLPISNVCFLFSKYIWWFMSNLWVENNVFFKKWKIIPF